MVYNAYVTQRAVCPESRPDTSETGVKILDKKIPISYVGAVARLGYL
jgi:hypothetical protein